MEMLFVLNVNQVINYMRIWIELPVLTYNQLYTKEKLKLINLKNK